METTIDRCHICLEDVEAIPINLLKTCCDAFICNECWLNITDNNLISNCPICNHPLNTIVPTPTERRDLTWIDRYEKYICGLFKLISWILVGYTTVLFLLFITYYDNNGKVLSIIKEISLDFKFWIIIIPFGYIIQTMIICLLSKLCNLNI